jgi:large subunit ribosomal protein L21
MSKNAVVRIGGNQYLVKDGESVVVSGASKPNIETLLYFEDGSNPKIGTPVVNGISYELEKIKDEKSKKVRVIKFKAKSRYKKNVGHRQTVTTYKINFINNNGS